MTLQIHEDIVDKILSEVDDKYNYNDGYKTDDLRTAIYKILTKCNISLPSENREE